MRAKVYKQLSFEGARIERATAIEFHRTNCKLHWHMFHKRNTRFFTRCVYQTKQDFFFKQIPSSHFHRQNFHHLAACMQSVSESIEYVRYKKILPTLRLIKCCSPNTKYLARSRWHTLMERLKIEANVISQNEIAFYVLYIYVCVICIDLLHPLCCCNIVERLKALQKNAMEYG